MISATRFAREHKRAIYHIYTSSHRLELEKHVDRISGEMMHSYVEEQARGLRVSAQDKKLVCDLYRFGITDIFYEWLENGMKEDLEAQIRRLSLLSYSQFVPGKTGMNTVGCASLWEHTWMLFA